MKHAVIIGHPQPHSFTQAVAQTYRQTLETMGDVAIVRDLYAMDFDPRLTGAERPDLPGGRPRADVLAERELLSDVDVFAFFYPLWFNMPPAIIKGYVDRVFCRGFGYDLSQHGELRPRLAGRQLVSFTSSGFSKSWLEEHGNWLSLRNLFDETIARLCGLRIVDHVHFADVHGDREDRWVKADLNTVADRTKRMFGLNRAAKRQVP